MAITIFAICCSTVRPLCVLSLSSEKGTKHLPFPANSNSNKNDVNLLFLHSHFRKRSHKRIQIKRVKRWCFSENNNCHATIEKLVEMKVLHCWNENEIRTMNMQEELFAKYHYFTSSKNFCLWKIKDDTLFERL